MRKGLIAAICTLVALAPGAAALAEREYARASGSPGQVLHHYLTADLDPVAHTLMAEDRLTLRGRGQRRFVFRLNRNLEVVSAATDSGAVLLPARMEQEEAPEHLATYSVEIPRDAGELRICYEGVVYDPVREETALAHVRGDTTTGIISEDGIYLDGGSGWYPTEEEALAAFEFELKVPEPFMLVAQGNLVERAMTDGHQVSRWRSDIPQDSFTLVGNEYAVSSRTVNEVVLSTYLFPAHAQLADRLLDASEEYLRFYTGLLGEFPYNRFDIVENFFQTGYGMPGFTLLGDAVLAMLEQGGYDVTGPSGIGHELMHNWWGNYVFFDADQGNWCEAITTYLTNYYWLEAHGQDAEARQWRQQASVKFSLYAPPGAAYPLRQFRGKESEADGAIGYEKGAMFFHALRRRLGDAAFFGALRKVIAEHGGGFACWDDFRHACEESSGTTLGGVFTQWLDRPGLPDFRLELETSGNGDSVTARVVQEEPVWDLLLDFRATDSAGKLQVESRIRLDGTTGWVSFGSDSGSAGDADLGTIIGELDPEWHQMRRVPARALEPCLNAVLNEPGAIVVYPSGTDGLSHEMLKLVATIEQGGRELTLLPDTEFTSTLAEQHSVFVLGGSATNRAWEAIGGLIPRELFTSNRKSYSFQRRVFMDPSESVLITFNHPQRPGSFISVYHANSVEALERARYIFFYGWDSYLLFAAGRPVERGMLPAATTPWRSVIAQFAQPAGQGEDDEKKQVD